MPHRPEPDGPGIGAFVWLIIVTPAAVLVISLWALGRPQENGGEMSALRAEILEIGQGEPDVPGRVPQALSARIAVGDMPGAKAGRAPALFAAYGCGACHRIAGIAGANGRTGPDLTRLAAQGYLPGGMGNAPGTLMQWIMNPTTVSPRTAMPDLDVTEQDARDMAAYLIAAGRR